MPTGTRSRSTPASRRVFLGKEQQHLRRAHAPRAPGRAPGDQPVLHGRRVPTGAPAGSAEAQQDNGSLRNWGGTAFNSIGGGDGTTNLIDPTKPEQGVLVFTERRVHQMDRRGSTSNFGATTSDRRNWVTPIVFDPNNPAIMYYAGNRVNRSTIRP